VLDIFVNLIYYGAMKKTTTFHKLIKKNRKLLLSKGFLPSTLTMWKQGNRYPRKNMAQKLAKILNVPISAIPYRETKWNLI
jgi:transcriptional regulator with XRE-family HTH domain